MQPANQTVTRARTWAVPLVLALAVLPLLTACQPESTEVAIDEVNYWEQRKGACEQILGSPQAYEAPDVINCMKVWETYRSVGDLSVDMRSMYAVAFSLAWYQSPDDYTREVAEAALARLCIPRHPMGNDGKIREEVPTALQCGSTSTTANLENGGGSDTAAAEVATQDTTLADLRGTVTTKDVGEKRAKKAKGFNKKALRAHNKKQFGNALDLYDQALDLYPHYVLAKYNKACALALMGDDEGSLDELQDLYTWDDPSVNNQLIKARTDPDLLAVREYPRFKLLTGYFRLTIANGAGEFGLPEIGRITTELQNRRYAIHQVVENQDPVLAPFIYYKPGFEAYAEEFRLIIGNNVQMQVMEWETLEDIVILWGEQDAAQLFAGDSQAAPIVQGTRAEDKGDGIGEITGAVKDVQGGAEDLKGTGEGVAEGVP